MCAPAAADRATPSSCKAAPELKAPPPRPSAGCLRLWALAASLALGSKLSPALGCEGEATLRVLGSLVALVAAAASVPAWGSPAASCKGHAHGANAAKIDAALEDATLGSYEDPLRWAFVGDGVVHRANITEPAVHENDQCTVKAIAMHRPTHEPWREESRSYPFAWHLAGRKRHFEIRVQIRLKRVPEGPIHFGVVLGSMGKASSMGRRVTRILIAAARQLVGEFYQSFGDDPSAVQGEAEPPTFVMPLFAFDQFVVSEVGQEPDLAGDLEGIGMRRTDGIAAYTKAMKATIDSFSTDKVYTFSFWGVSQFLDCMNWELVGGFLPFTSGRRFDFSKAGCEPPINVVAYEMPGVSPTDEDRRHLPSRKRYLLNVVMWSKLKPPAREVLRSILADSAPQEETQGSQNSRPRRHLAPLFGLFTCCTART